MSGCRRVLPLLDPYIDGELSPERVVEVRQHLVDCTVCTERVRLAHALRLTLRGAVCRGAEPSTAFEARVRAALAAEREREFESANSLSRESRFGMLPWRTVVPVAAAASLTMAWAAQAGDVAAPTQTSFQKSDMTPNPEQLIEELLDLHARAPAPDITDPWSVRKFEPEVGVPVRLPGWHPFGARWKGGSIVPVRFNDKHAERAASLRYELDGHRITVYVYDANRFPLHKTQTLTARTVRNEPIYVGCRRGYSIGVRERRGMGYAITTDLTDGETVELLAAIH
jgi:negative regulator of sigma E activity